MPGRSGSSESTSEEFRGVIDDLTVTIKKLRAKLKKYEKLHCSHLQAEKLFEVRVHGLPVQRKLELEQLLREFAISLEEAPDPEPTSIRLDAHSSGCKLSSLSTSDSKPHDSTYASISASGLTLNSRSNPNRGRKGGKSDGTGHDVRPDLHHIPSGPLPQRSPFISTRAKRNVVVRRLEQLFTGRRGVDTGDTQSHQQQEVSRSATSGGAGAGEVRSQADGVREARILRPTMAPHVATGRGEAHASGHAHEPSEGEDRLGSMPATREGTPDQRPTRPLDLDLHRAQVPADNIQYIKHLGLASPVADAGTGSRPVNGWVYLNLLVGMAQLHTLNVTPAFIRKAIVDISTQFELSADGRKIRWVGDHQGSRLSSESGESTGAPTRVGWPESDPMAARPHRAGGSSPGKAGSDGQSDARATSQASNCSSSSDGADADRRPVFLAPSNRATSFHYQPLFFRRALSEDEECYIHEGGSLTSSQKVEHSNALGSVSRGAPAPTATPPKIAGRKENGPIIFYKKANFCTDLSGDLDYDSREDVTFTRYVKDPVGYDEGGSWRGGLGHEWERLLVRAIGEPMDNKEVEMESSCLTETCLTLEDMSSADGADAFTRAKPVYLEVSGLGGVQPHDNFCIEVTMQHGGPPRDFVTSKPFARPLNSRGLGFSIGEKYFHKVQVPRATKEGSPSRARSKILSLTTTMLPHSVLPEPSYINLPFSSDNEEEDESGDGLDSDDGKGQLLPLSISDIVDVEPENQMPLETLFGLRDSRKSSSQSSSSSSGEKSSTTVSDDSSSIDLLAHARELDPETIAAREREFDSNLGLPLADVLAGSSAATAGGGSGVPSEISGSSSESESGNSSEGTEEKERGGNGGRLSVKRRRLGGAQEG